MITLQEPQNIKSCPYYTHVSKCIGDGCIRYNRCCVEDIRAYLQFVELLGISLFAEDISKIIESAGYCNRDDFVKELLKKMRGGKK